LAAKKEDEYLYHEGYVYCSICLESGDYFENTTVIKRAKNNGEEITAFDKTEKCTTRDGNYRFWEELYHYYPMIIDGNVHFKIIYEEIKRSPLGERPSDSYDEQRKLTEFIYKVKADGIRDLEG